MWVNCDSDVLKSTIIITQMCIHQKLHRSMQEHYNKFGRYLNALKISSLKAYLLLVINPYKKTFPPVFQGYLFVLMDQKLGGLKVVRSSYVLIHVF